MQKAYNRIFDPTRSINTWNGAANKITGLVNRDDHPSGRFLNHNYCHEETSEVPYLPCHGNCFFQSSNGTTGLCPSGARENDLVVIHSGGNVPYLLRPKSRSAESSHTFNEFHFVGECYFSDYMDGGFMSRPQAAANERVFVLV
jgi:hypothetical protein